MGEEIIILFLLVAFALSSLGLKYLKPRVRGNYGEAKVASIVRRLSSKKFKVLNNLLIQNKSRSSQIDHVIVSIYGVFVIETKNYKGWIFGHESSDDWTQTLFRKKYKFRNPVLQAWGHIHTLKSVLSEYPDIPYYPIIVFTGSAKLKNIRSKIPVIQSNKLRCTISNVCKSEYLSKEEVLEVYQKLVRLNSSDKVSRKSHVRKAKGNRRKPLRSNTCPRCGGRLLLKDGKYGMFYGCSSFPGCNYSKDYGK